MAEYVPPTDEELDSLVGDVNGLDRAVYETGPGALTPKQRVQKVYVDHAYDAALSIIALSKGASNENTRLRAAQYVTDRALGPVRADEQGKDGENDSLEDMVKVFTKAQEVDGR